MPHRTRFKGRSEPCSWNGLPLILCPLPLYERKQALIADLLKQREAAIKGFDQKEGSRGAGYRR
jgi:hypothetical protein